MITGNRELDLQIAQNQTIGANSKYRRLAKKLSTDKPYEDLYPTKVLPDLGASFIIYANGATWVLECWVNWRLYWISSNTDINNLRSENAEYNCTWLPNYWHIRNIRRIIWKHPNMSNWTSIFLPTKIIELLWKLGFRFTSCR
jgi:hypothetical protein